MLPVSNTADWHAARVTYFRIGIDAIAGARQRMACRIQPNGLKKVPAIEPSQFFAVRLDLLRNMDALNKGQRGTGVIVAEDAAEPAGAVATELEAVNGKTDTWAHLVGHNAIEQRIGE